MRVTEWAPLGHQGTAGSIVPQGQAQPQGERKKSGLEHCIDQRRDENCRMTKKGTMEKCLWKTSPVKTGMGVR